MKINYHNEDYNAVLFNLIIYTVLMLFVIIYGIYFDLFNSIKNLVYLLIFLLPLALFFIFDLKKYIKCKIQRNLNVFIMNNGKVFDGKIISINDNIIINYEHRSVHNITATVEFIIEGQIKNLIVDNLIINCKHYKEYLNKTAKVYIYSNMNYVDILNG